MKMSKRIAVSLALGMAIFWSTTMAAIQPEDKNVLAWVLPNDVGEAISLSLTRPNDAYLSTAVPSSGQPFLVLHKETGPNGGFLIVHYGLAGQMKEVFRLRTEDQHLGTLDNFYLMPGSCRPDALPDIVVYQTSLPAKGDRDFRPGPPIDYRFAYNGETYDIIESGCTVTE